MSARYVECRSCGIFYTIAAGDLLIDHDHECLTCGSVADLVPCWCLPANVEPAFEVWSLAGTLRLLAIRGVAV